MIVAAGVDVLECVRLVIMPFRIGTLKEETFNFVGRIQGVTLLVVKSIGIVLEHSTDVSGIGFAVLRDHLAKYQHFAGAEIVRWHPIERTPIDSQPKIALSLGGEAANRTAIEG